MPKIILGLDICESSVAAAVLKLSFKTKQILFLRRIRFPEKNDNWSENLSEALRDLSRSLPASPDAVCASIPSGSISYRRIAAPFKNSQKIRRILPYELETTLIEPVNEAVIDFFPTSAGENPKILAAVIKQETLETYIQILADAGFEPETISPSGHATALHLANTDRLPDQALLLHIDSFTGTIHEITRGELIFIRAFRIPESCPDRHHAIVQNIFWTIAASRDQLAWDFFPERIFASGIDKELEKLIGFTETNLNVPTMPVSPAILTESPMLPGEREAAPIRCVNALALAMNESARFGNLNFRKGEFGAKGKWNENKSALTKTVILASLTLLIVISAIFLQNRAMQNRLNYLNKEITTIFTSTFPEVGRIVDPYQQMRIQVKEAEKESAAPGYNHRNIRAIDVLREISKRISPEADVKVERMVLSPDDAQFSGTADTFKTVNEIQNGLEQIPFFSNVTISAANQERAGNSVQFKIKADF